MQLRNGLSRLSFADDDEVQ